MTACAVYPRWVPEGPEAYRDGYLDGCRTGTLARVAGAGYVERKEKDRYTQNTNYRRGWDEARGYCQANPVISPYSNEPGEPGGAATMGGGTPAGK